MTNRYEVISDQTVKMILKNGTEVLLNKEDLPLVSLYTWNSNKNKNSKNGERLYIACRIDNKTTYVHRLITNAPKGVEVDHINHDTLDNRRENLRLVTHKENDANRDGAYNTSRLGIRGVSIHQSNNSDQRKYYAFRCHVEICKDHKFFPLTENGLREAEQYSRDHYLALANGTPKPKQKGSTATGVKGISIQNYKGSPHYYLARKMINKKSIAKTFPFTPEGLVLAENFIKNKY